MTTPKNMCEIPSTSGLQTGSFILRRPVYGVNYDCLDSFNISDDHSEDDRIKGSGTAISSPWYLPNIIKPSQRSVLPPFQGCSSNSTSSAPLFPETANVLMMNKCDDFIYKNSKTEIYNYFQLMDDIFKKESAITRYVLNIVDEEHGKKYRIPVDASKKIIDVKTDMYACSDIKVSQQLWSGWPVSCTSDDLMLSQLGLTEPVLELSFRVAPISMSSNLSVEKDINRSMEVDVFSSDEDEYYTELIMGTDDSGFTLSDDSDEYPMNSNIDSLVPQDFKDEAAASVQFAVSFQEKYGKLHPDFFKGTFSDALNEATCKSASKNKLFAVYLHHNKSILSNIFCSQLLCTELVVQYLSEHFILWGWDVTLESNKTHFLRCLENFLSNENSEVIMRLKDLKIDKYPVIVVISEVPRKTFLILGHVDLDELLSRLIEIVEECGDTEQIAIDNESTDRTDNPISNVENTPVIDSSRVLDR